MGSDTPASLFDLLCRSGPTLQQLLDSDRLWPHSVLSTQTNVLEFLPAQPHPTICSGAVPVNNHSHHHPTVSETTYNAENDSVDHDEDRYLIFDIRHTYHPFRQASIESANIWPYHSIQVQSKDEWLLIPPGLEAWRNYANDTFSLSTSTSSIDGDSPASQGIPLRGTLAQRTYPDIRTMMLYACYHDEISVLLAVIILFII